MPFRIAVCCTVVVLALAVGAVIAVRAVDNFTWCSSRIVREFPSPDGGLTVVVGATGCGATGPDVSFVMMRRPNKKFDIAGDDYFFAIGGINEIEVVWGGL